MELFFFTIITICVVFVVDYISRYLIANRIEFAKNKKKGIPFYYFFIIIFSVLIELIVYWNFGYSVDSIFYFLFFILLFIAAIVDFKLNLIPNEISIVGLVIALIYLIFRDDISAINAISTAIVCAIFLYFISWIMHMLHRKGGIGFGDIKLLIFTAIFLGFTHFFTVMAVSFLLTSIVSLFLSLISKKKDLLSGELAFAPSVFFVVLGYFFLLSTK